jgi:hypothetical protein
MPINFRLMLWCALWFIGAIVAYQIELANSRAAYAAGDHSAFAWHGFVVFLVPIFFMQSACVVLPLAFCVEFFLWLEREAKLWNS